MKSRYDNTCKRYSFFFILSSILWNRSGSASVLLLYESAPFRRGSSHKEVAPQGGAAPIRKLPRKAGDRKV